MASIKKRIFGVFALVIIAASYLAYMRIGSDNHQDLSYEDWSRQYQKDDRYYQTMSKHVLEPDFDFERVELVLVSPGPRYYSKLGHLFMRFYGSGSDRNEDLTLSFLIETSDYEIDNWLGFWGGKYRIYPLIKPWQVQVKSYIEEEKRSFQRYELKISEQHKARLKEVLREYVKDRSKLGTWAMYNNSCTNRVNEYLLAAGFPSPYKTGPQMIWPEWLVEKYLEAGLVTKVSE